MKTKKKKKKEKERKSADLRRRVRDAVVPGAVQPAIVVLQRVVVVEVRSIIYALLDRLPVWPYRLPVPAYARLSTARRVGP
eukprot:3847337-Rhodomonas_salina.1